MAKTYLITGANRGIGFELVRQALEGGCKVLACTREAGRSKPLNSLIGKNGELELLNFDVTSETAINRVAANVSSKIDVVICNAGVLNSYGGIEDEAHTSAAINSVLMTNVAGVFFTVRSFLPHLKKDNENTFDGTIKGKIAIISSQMGSQKTATERAPIYRASKAAATNLARCFAVELASDKIAVGAYHPGWVRTDMGGPTADVSASESAKGLLARVDLLSLKTSGVVESYSGKPIPF